MKGRVLFSAGLVCALAACASSGGPPPEKHERITSITASEITRATGLTAPETIHVGAKPDSVFRLLRSIYPELGVEVKLFDPAAGAIGNNNFSLYYRLKGISLHNFVGCGTTATGPTADLYRVTMSLVSYVFPDSAGSTVSTRVEARANDAGLSRGAVTCASTGVLEGRVKAALIAKVGG